jgi:phage recombination protein Bet
MSTELSIPADVPGVYSQAQIDLITRTVCKGATRDELALTLAYSRRTGLDLLTKQLYAIKYGGQLTFQTSIDGFRLIAERSGKYAGQVGPWWCGSDGKWLEVWTVAGPPFAARIGVLRSDFKEPLYAVARYSSYVKRGRDGQPQGLWATMADVLIAKCAESLALRKGFPNELGGVYTGEEMAQANNGHAAPAQTPWLERQLAKIASMKPEDLPKAKEWLVNNAMQFDPVEMDEVLAAIERRLQDSQAEEAATDVAPWDREAGQEG